MQVSCFCEISWFFFYYPHALLIYLSISWVITPFVYFICWPFQLICPSQGLYLQKLYSEVFTSSPGSILIYYLRRRSSLGTRGGLTLHNSRQFSGYSLSYFCIRHLVTSPILNPAMSHMWKCSVCSLEFSPSPSLSVIPRPRPISDLTAECLAYIAAQQGNSLPALRERAICLPWGQRRTDGSVGVWWNLDS